MDDELEERDCFQHRCSTARKGKPFFWRGIAVTRTGNQKFYCEGRRGDWKRVYEKMKETVAARATVKSFD